MACLGISAGSKKIVEELNSKRFASHLNICSYKTFEELIRNGFDAEKWENTPKNYGNKIFIGNIPFREYNKNNNGR